MIYFACPHVYIIDTCTVYVHVTCYMLHVCTCTPQKNDELFSSVQLVKLALGVARGMEYLSTIGYVHRVSRPVPNECVHVVCGRSVDYRQSVGSNWDSVFLKALEGRVVYRMSPEEIQSCEAVLIC